MSLQPQDLGDATDAIPLNWRIQIDAPRRIANGGRAGGRQAGGRRARSVSI